MAEDPEAHSSTHRVEAFSDGVFAIAITLLIIEIAVPHVEGDQSLGEAISDLWPSYFAYALSFITIGIYWANHHSFFQLFRRLDHFFLMFNVLFLMCISFLPFPTAVLADYLDNSDQRGDAVTFYCFGLLLPATAWLALWTYGRWRDLLADGLDPAYVRFATWQYIGSSGVYILAVVASLINPWAGIAMAASITGAYLLPPREPKYIEHQH